MGRFEQIFPEKTEAICETTLLHFRPTLKPFNRLYNNHSVPCPLSRWLNSDGFWWRIREWSRARSSWCLINTAKMFGDRCIWILENLAVWLKRWMNVLRTAYIPSVRVQREKSHLRQRGRVLCKISNELPLNFDYRWWISAILDPLSLTDTLVFVVDLFHWSSGCAGCWFISLRFLPSFTDSNCAAGGTSKALGERERLPKFQARRRRWIVIMFLF